MGVNPPLIRWILNPKITAVVMTVLYVAQAAGQFYSGNWRLGVYWLAASVMPCVLAF